MKKIIYFLLLTILFIPMTIFAEEKDSNIELLKNAKADSSVLTLKSFEALAKVADGQSTKIIIPSELQNIASLATVFNETKK